MSVPKLKIKAERQWIRVWSSTTRFNRIYTLITARNRPSFSLLVTQVIHFIFIFALHFLRKAVFFQIFFNNFPRFKLLSQWIHKWNNCSLLSCSLNVHPKETSFSALKFSLDPTSFKMSIYFIFTGENHVASRNS